MSHGSSDSELVGYAWRGSTLDREFIGRIRCFLVGSLTMSACLLVFFFHVANASLVWFGFFAPPNTLLFGVFFVINDDILLYR